LDFRINANVKYKKRGADVSGFLSVKPNSPYFFIHCSLLAFSVQIGFQRWQRHTLLQFGRGWDDATGKVYGS